jgi:hypothetical protein
MARLPKPRACCLLTLFLAAPFPVPGQNQDQASQQASPPTAKNQIRVVTNEIVVPVTATDATGDFVLDLAQKDFHIFDDGAEQAIDHWELGGDPLAVALVIETSSRLRAMVPVIHSLAAVFTETVMALDGEAAVITYDSTVELRQPFTTDHDAVEKAIAKTEFEAPERNLYDAMAFAVQLLKTQPPTRRRIMLVLGESQDDGSRASLSQVARGAEHANISIYALGPSSVATDLRSNNKVSPLKLRGLPPISAGPPPYELTAAAIWLLERGTYAVQKSPIAGCRCCHRRNSVPCVS